jgi:hypothetical protein
MKFAQNANDEVQGDVRKVGQFSAVLEKVVRKNKKQILNSKGI